MPGSTIRPVDVINDLHEKGGSGMKAPAAGYRDLSGQTVELPAYRFNGTEAEYIGMQSFTFPEKAKDNAAAPGQT